MPNQFSHQSVLQSEAINALAIQPNGVYIDATFGRGGHSAAILAKLDAAGRLFAIDQDAEALVAAKRFAADARFCISRANFAELEALAKTWGVDGQVDGILLDIGVSSPQLDDPARGFSFMHDGDLDMRMDCDSGQSVAAWLAKVEQDELANVIYKYGEERNSRRIAKAIVERRAVLPITRTLDLANIIAAVNKAGSRHKHPATRTFQALRIYINRELEVLEDALVAALKVLKPRGRLVVISFHSLEDRIVKTFMRDMSRGVAQPRHLPAAPPTFLPLELIGKAQKPSAAEIAQNPRARSAVLRVAAKRCEVAA